MPAAAPGVPHRSRIDVLHRTNRIRHRRSNHDPMHQDRAKHHRPVGRSARIHPNVVLITGAAGTNPGSAWPRKAVAGGAGRTMPFAFDLRDAQGATPCRSTGGQNRPRRDWSNWRRAGRARQLPELTLPRPAARLARARRCTGTPGRSHTPAALNVINREHLENTRSSRASHPPSRPSAPSQAAPWPGGCLAGAV